MDDLEGVNVKNGRLHVERLEKATPKGARDFSISLYELLPRVKLTDLLMEVAHWTGFHEQVVHASTNRVPNEEETTILMASLMAMGTNIGLTKIADATPNISY
ncbi:MAG: Tn3 family transposase [Desulfosporosinus sp.]|nr:Tn3 family transposase [Desulfosporosinus sp.]